MFGLSLFSLTYFTLKKKKKKGKNSEILKSCIYDQIS
jgi:hypothetical protein